MRLSLINGREQILEVFQFQRTMFYLFILFWFFDCVRNDMFIFILLMIFKQHSYFQMWFKKIFIYHLDLNSLQQVFTTHGIIIWILLQALHIPILITEILIMHVNSYPNVIFHRTKLFSAVLTMIRNLLYDQISNRNENAIQIFKSLFIAHKFISYLSYTWINNKSRK